MYKWFNMNWHIFECPLTELDEAVMEIREISNDIEESQEEFDDSLETFLNNDAAVDLTKDSINEFGTIMEAAGMEIPLKPFLDMLDSATAEEFNASLDNIFN